MANSLHSHFETVAQKGLNAYSLDPSQKEGYGEVSASSGSLENNEQVKTRPQYLNDNGNVVLDFQTQNADATSTNPNGTDIDLYRFWMSTAGNADTKDASLLVASWESSVTGLENGQEYQMNDAQFGATPGFARQIVVGTNNNADYDFQVFYNSGSSPKESRNSNSDFITNWTGSALQLIWNGTNIELENTSGSEWTGTSNLQIDVNGEKLVNGSLSQTYDVPNNGTLIIESIKVTYQP